ncbi:MAG: Eco57I restriction-modification methylase domain-containing protein [Candidatus Aminicenantes bacterium]|nr:Eco57I restriction-modification methylase domain-containing protein [Candidatus Aminicenantes bacterium]
MQNQAEAQIENNFIRPLFRYLNWNTSNEGLAVVDYEFILNRTSRGGKRPDYTLQLDGQHLLVMDAKQVKYDMHDPRWLNQVYAYGYSTQNLAPARRIDFAVLSDFEEFVVLDCTLHVNDPRALRNFLVLNWTCDDYVNQFDRLWDLFERENMRRTARTRHSDTPRGLWALALSPRKVKANRTPPDKAFLADMDNDKNGWRVRLAKDMKKLNPAADGALITAAVQLLIDRLIFVKALSDREIEDDYLERLAETIEKDGLAENDNGWFAACSNIFKKLNNFYNGNIFKSRPELEAVTVSNKTMRDIIRSLQPENSPYNFAVLPVEILGTIYERFLGRVVRTTEQRVKIEEKPEVRKAGGVYYTPQYIVKYIVRNTVGNLLENCRAPTDVVKLKILDPACGSGSFLVGAYAALIDWHIKYYDTKKKLSAADRADAYYDSDGRVRLTARLKRQILINNLFGVDIDQQAVEVTRFSLSLKALEDTRREELYEERSLFKETVLPDLNDNIKCGNSLIGPDYFSGKMFPDAEELRRVNTFDWQREFPAIFPKWNKGLKPLVDREIDADLWFVTFVTHNSRVSERMVTFGVKSGEPLFFSPEDQIFVAEKIAEKCKKENITVVAMNILPDHVHMVIAATDETDLTEKIRKIKGYSSYEFQRFWEWAKGTEHVWAQKFNSRLIKDDNGLATIIHYVQNNHLKHAERWGDDGSVNKGLKPLVPGKPQLVSDASPLVEYNSGFDTVIGNPPYIRIQTLKETNPEQVKYIKEKYRAAGSGNYDIYVVFVEKGLALLNPSGCLGFILPHKFFNSKYGAPLRGVIAEGKHLSHVVHFGDQQVFDGASTYTALMFLDKAGCDDCEYVKVSDLEAWQSELDKGGNRDGGTGGKMGSNKGLKPLVESISSITADRITSAEWNFSVGRGSKLFERLSKVQTKLRDIAYRIYQGPITSADSVFLFKEFRIKTKNIIDVFSKELNSTPTYN